jgi:hypothetical protein
VVGAAWQLLACVSALLLARALFDPIGALLATVNGQSSPAAAYVCALAAAAAILWIAAIAIRGPMTRRARRLHLEAAPAMRAALAAALGVAWAAALAAMALAFVSELVVLDVAYRAIQGSASAQTLIGSWNVLFPPLI